jgi:hypothetical protein
MNVAILQNTALHWAAVAAMYKSVCQELCDSCANIPMK